MLGSLAASLSLALIGVGHLVGVTVGAAMVVGLYRATQRLAEDRTDSRPGPPISR